VDKRNEVGMHLFILSRI